MAWNVLEDDSVRISRGRHMHCTCRRRVQGGSKTDDEERRVWGGDDKRKARDWTRRRVWLYAGNIILRSSLGTGNHRMGNNIPQRLEYVCDLLCVAGNHIWIKHTLKRLSLHSVLQKTNSKSKKEQKCFTDSEMSQFSRPCIKMQNYLCSIVFDLIWCYVWSTSLCSASLS